MPGANLDQLPAGIPKSYLNDLVSVLITTSHPEVAAATVLLLVELFLKQGQAVIVLGPSSGVYRNYRPRGQCTIEA